jgi:type II secretory pathway pseudopilin PulG
VILILGILAALAIPKYINLVDISKHESKEGAFGALQQALVHYKVEDSILNSRDGVGPAAVGTLFTEAVTTGSTQANFPLTILQVNYTAPGTMAAALAPSGWTITAGATAS